MAIKKRNTIADEALSGSSDTDDIESEPRAKYSRKPKLTVPLNEDGTIAYERFKPGQREQFTALVGIQEGIEKPPTFKVNRDFIPHLYDGVAGAIQTVGKMFLKWPAELTVLMRYSDEQKEKLTEPTALVIEKYSPKWLIANQEIAALCIAFTACTKEMMESAMIQFVLEQGGKVQAAKPNGKDHSAENLSS